MMLPPIERLQERFDYETETGVLTHRSYGKPVGWKDKKGYLIVNVSNEGRKHKVFAHRLIWALVHGRWPVNEIDHRDGDHLNNKLSNLREATHGENGQNLRPSLTRGTVFDGATPRLKRRWRAYIKVDNKQVWLGSFLTREEAHAAYLAAKPSFHAFQPVPR
jgi:hypothetical protein